MTVDKSEPYVTFDQTSLDIKEDNSFELTIKGKIERLDIATGAVGQITSATLQHILNGHVTPDAMQSAEVRDEITLLNARSISQ